MNYSVKLKSRVHYELTVDAENEEQATNMAKKAVKQIQKGEALTNPKVIVDKQYSHRIDVE